MEYQEIKTLLDRYFQGTSTLEEEVSLRRYFAGSEVDARLEQYAPVFRFFAREQAVRMDENRVNVLMDQLPDSPGRTRSLMSVSVQWIGRIAAVLVLMVGMWWAYQSQQVPDQTAAVDWSKYEITDEKEALEITRGALFKVSKTLNQGAKAAATQIDHMQDMGQFFEVLK